ncbi:MAG: AraC family transcriptional regulator [Castellaniella sp.]|uniref:Helix-turn-helix domain-containing protein n=1 Tax=Castellaniella hirudinis TaxID=1144617 RepID=A0ABV8S0M1_9BURK
MRLDYFLPSPWAQAALTMHAVVEGIAEPRTEILPAMLPNLFVRLDGHSRVALDGGPFIDAPPVTLLGPTCGAYRLMLSAGCRLLTIGLLPGGWARCLPMPAHECVDTLVDGAALWGETATAEIIERLQAAPLNGAHVGLIERFLMHGPRRASHPGMLRLAGIDAWLERSPALSLDTLCTQLDVSARQLRRITLEGYGMSPKTLAMKYRALRLASSLSLARELPPTNPWQAEYADQSHMIRDFRRFIGWTPQAFRLEQRNVAAATLIGRHQAGAIRPLALLS